MSAYLMHYLKRLTFDRPFIQSPLLCTGRGDTQQLHGLPHQVKRAGEDHKCLAGTLLKRFFQRIRTPNFRGRMDCPANCGQLRRVGGASARALDDCIGDGSVGRCRRLPDSMGRKRVNRRILSACWHACATSPLVRALRSTAASARLRAAVARTVSAAARRRSSARLARAAFVSKFRSWSTHNRASS